MDEEAPDGFAWAQVPRSRQQHFRKPSLCATCATARAYPVPMETGYALLHFEWRTSLSENRCPPSPSQGHAFPGHALEALAGAGFERANQTIDEGLRGALVGHRIEQPSQRRPGQMGAHPRVVAEDV